MSSDTLPRRSHIGWEVLSRLFLVTWPFALSFQVWIVTKIHSHDLQLQSIRTWQGTKPQFTHDDAESLRIRLLAESRVEMGVQLGIISGKLEAIQSSVIRLDERYQLTNRRD